MWGRDATHVAEMAEARENTRYLPGASFPYNLVVHDELESTLDGVRDILIAVPSHALREIAKAIKPYVAEDTRIFMPDLFWHLFAGLPSIFDKQQRTVFHKMTYVGTKTLWVPEDSRSIFGS